MNTFSFKEYLDNKALREDLHPELQAALEQPNPRDSHTQFTRTVKKLEKQGETTGLEGTKYSGSSRVFYPHNEPTKIKLDGQTIPMKTGTKFAKKFTLDNYQNSGMLLGQHQNIAEADAGSGHYGLFHHNEDGSFSTNKDSGVVAPVLHHHPDGHHLTMVRAEKFNSAKFKEATKTDDFPKGITLKEFQLTLHRAHDRSHGKYHNYEGAYGVSHERLDKLEEHPLVEKFMNHMFDTGHHPGDISPRNMGIIKHPIGGKLYPVLVDAGYDKNSQDLYATARKNLSNKKYRGY